MSPRRLVATLTSPRLPAVLAVGAASLLATAGSASARTPFLDSLHTVTTITSTVPPNGDVNPYGIAVVPKSSGRLVRGNILVSNFNNSQNLQGTGTTIDEITPSGKRGVFAAINAAQLPGPCPGGVGLTTALVALRSGYVVVGSLPTTNGMAATAMAGCLLVLNHSGQVVETIAGRSINGPWDMTAADNGSTATLFVTNVLNGTVAANGAVVHKGTVVRIVLSSAHGSIPTPKSITVIGNGFAERTDPNALVIGPTGVAFSGSDNTLYVADTLNSRIAAIPKAMARTTPLGGAGKSVSSGGKLNAPLGLTFAPDGDLIAANGGDGNLVEVSKVGGQLASKTVDPAGAGVLFGLTIPDRHRLYFVDDGDNTLRLLH